MPKDTVAELLNYWAGRSDAALQELRKGRDPHDQLASPNTTELLKAKGVAVGKHQGGQDLRVGDGRRSKGGGEVTGNMKGPGLREGRKLNGLEGRVWVGEPEGARGRLLNAKGVASAGTRSRRIATDCAERCCSNRVGGSGAWTGSVSRVAAVCREWGGLTLIAICQVGHRPKYPMP